MFITKKCLLCVIGTRPEAIKMAPIISELKNKSWANVVVLATAQHRQMLDQVLKLFDVTPDFDLNVMQANQSLPDLTARLIQGLAAVMVDVKPDMVIAQGDTTTVLASAMVAFYQKIPFAHVEAGLRTGNLSNPFPEEMNRAVVGRMAQLHFAPTEIAKSNLLREGIDERQVSVTGNTVIDALYETASKQICHGLKTDPTKRIILLTAHRRENFGQPMKEIFLAVLDLIRRNRDIQVVYPVHPNPNVSALAMEMFSTTERIILCQPLDYAPFVAMMKASYLILTDSGGVQEEAPALGKPVLVLRSETERPEAVAEGVVKVVGTNRTRIVEEVESLLSQPANYLLMAKGVSPYGDGFAAGRIAKLIGDHFKFAD